MESKYTYVKLRTNIPEPMTFKFNEPRELEGQYGKFYSYGVEWKGEDAYLSATPRLKEELDKYGPLEGRQLEILKYEDEGGTKLWKILDARGNPLESAPAPDPSHMDIPEGATPAPVLRCPHCSRDIYIEIKGY